MLISLLCIAIAIFFSWHKTLRTYSFTIWVIAAAVSSNYYPTYFKEIGGFELSNLIIPLIIVIMFGMASTLSLKDFSRVITMPIPVIVGMICQFTIMPIVGFVLVNIFSLPIEIAAGLILVGCSPSGLASNVMAFIARADVALSITLTAIATILSPLLTPLLMKIFADQYISFNYLDMLWSISKIVILPTAGGLLYNHYIRGKMSWLDELMPSVSMVGIVIIIAIIMAAGQQYLLEIGFVLVIATALHNGLGYLAGYWLCKLAGMDEKVCRTISFEVGMQNSGLASGIAVELGKIATMGLPAVIFGPVMNISGSLLASWWKNRPIEDDVIANP